MLILRRLRRSYQAFICTEEPIATAEEPASPAWKSPPVVPPVLKEGQIDVRDLIAPTDYPRLDVDGVAKMFKDWEHHKMDNILTYRDKSHRSLLTGTVAPVHHTPWMKALDDSMEAFLNQPDAKVAAE